MLNIEAHIRGTINLTKDFSLFAASLVLSLGMFSIRDLFTFFILRLGRHFKSPSITLLEALAYHPVAPCDYVGIPVITSEINFRIAS